MPSILEENVNRKYGLIEVRGAIFVMIPWRVSDHVREMLSALLEAYFLSPPKLVSHVAAG